jgi:hypothetical protein
MDNSAWWKNSVFVAFLGFTIPAATAVQGWLQKDRELALQEQRQLQELRLAYVNVLVEGGLEGMGMVADFAASTEQDERIRLWAERLKQQANEAAQEERKQLEEQERKLAESEESRLAAEQRLLAAEARAAALEQRSTADRAAKEQAEAAASEARSALLAAARAKAKSDSTRDDIVRSKEALTGRSSALKASPDAKAQSIVHSFLKKPSQVSPAGGERVFSRGFESYD